MSHRYLSEDSSEEAALRAVGTTTETSPVASEIADAAAAEGLIFAVGGGTEPDGGALFFAAGAETESVDGATAGRGAKMSAGGGGGAEPFTAGAVTGLWRSTGALLQKKQSF
jgi:hypothetical protein